MYFYDTLDEGKPDPRPFTMTAETLEEAEDLLMKTRLDPNPIVFDEHDRLVTIGTDPHFHKGCWLIAHEFHGIVDEVLIHL